MAIVQNEFGPAKSLGGWIFREGPFRSQTWRARYYGVKPDHTGEPYVWAHCCPFCGRDLPPPPDDEGLEVDDGG